MGGRRKKAGELNARQVAFIDNYTAGPTAGQVYNSYKAAGYTGGRQSATNLFRSRHIQQALNNMGEKIEAVIEQVGIRDVATRTERHAILTEIMRNPEVEPQHRIAAIKVLGSMMGDFVLARQAGFEGGEESVGGIGGETFDELMAAAQRRLGAGRGPDYIDTEGEAGGEGEK